MRPGCPKNFWESLSIRPRLYLDYLEIFNGLFSRSILWMCLQNLKFVALPIPEIIGNTQQIWAVLGYAHAPFSKKLLMGFCSDVPVNVSGKFAVRIRTRLMRSWDNKMPRYRRDHRAMRPIYECPQNNVSAKSADVRMNLHVTTLSLFGGEIIFDIPSNVITAPSDLNVTDGQTDGHCGITAR